MHVFTSILSLQAKQGFIRAKRCFNAAHDRHVSKEQNK